MPVDKLTVAHQHVVTALKLVALGSLPHSIHILAMAADEILRSVAKSRSIDLHLDIERYISENRLKEFRAAKYRSYNFFKHADRDPEDELNRTDQQIADLNDMMLLQACSHLIQFGYTDRELTVFSSSMALLNPGVLDREGMEKSTPGLLAAYDELGDGFDRKTMREVLLITFIKRGDLSVDELEFAMEAEPHVNAL